MKWQGRRASTNVEDRRGRGGSRMIGSGLGIGTIVIIVIIALLDGNPADMLHDVLSPVTENAGTYVASAEEEQLAAFVSVVLAEAEDIWTALFENAGLIYEKPILVLYSGTVDSACGTSGASTGPFYCPGDQKVYIDLSFFQELKTEFNAPGDFAGVWAHYVDRTELLESGDLEAALAAASAVGADPIWPQIGKNERLVNGTRHPAGRHQHQRFGYNSLADQQNQSMIPSKSG